MSLALGLGVAVGAAPAVAAGGENPNLLLWTEEMDDAVWVKTLVTVTPDDAASPNPPGDGSTTADHCLWVSASRTLAQTTDIVASAGGDLVTFTPAVTWNREVVSADIDGTTYTASVYVQDAGSGGPQLRLFVEPSGGFLRVRLFSVGGAVLAHVWGWQLEVGAVATAYQKREGT